MDEDEQSVAEDSIVFHQRAQSARVPTPHTEVGYVESAVPEEPHVHAPAGPPALAENAALAQLRESHTDLDRYVYLRDLRDRSEELYYQVLINNAQEILPYVYTPTVGEACQKYSHLPIRPRGLFITPADKGRVAEKLRSWPQPSTRVVVVTDGERILGLGDLGYGGMGISEGKILLYTVVGGVDPALCLPVCLDVGTNNQSLLDDPLYKGLRQKRLRGPEYDELVDEFLTAVRGLPDHCLLQFEDFGNTNAFRLLDKYWPVQCCFNDDIQGTACICLAGLLSALRVTQRPLAEQTILFLGAGEAGTGIGQLIAATIAKETGVSLEEARRHCLYVDSKGLVVKSRTDLQHHKLPFAHDVPPEDSLLSAIRALKPSMLVGVSAQPGAFTEEICHEMAAINARPIIFPLSNPTALAEVTYADAFKWTDGKVVFASGSPFLPLKHEGKVFLPAQANNAYVFGPIGMAALMTKCKTITDDVFTVTAEALAALTPEDRLHVGMLFPAFSDMKTLVVPLISAIAQFMVSSGLGTAPAGVTDWEAYVKGELYIPKAPQRWARTPSARRKSISSMPADGALGLAAAPVPEEVEHEHELPELLELRHLPTDIERYLYLRTLQEKQPAAYWKLMLENAFELLPFVYTPTVGEACQKYSSLPLQTHGLFISKEDKGKILEKLQSWPQQNVRVIVVTDGERILGLGDLGYGGMGISEGKITLYTVIAGVPPSQCLPICLDVGTNREALRNDPDYKGLREPRLKGPAFDELMAEFMGALRQWQPHLLLQFEDFGNTNAFRLLETYRGQQCCFNDDIQGTACICLAGLLSALRITKRPLAEQTILFLGAGEAGTGIGHLIAMAMVKLGGLSVEEAMGRNFFMDSQGLVVKSRTGLQHHKLAFAHDVPFQAKLLDAVRALRPTMLIGVSTQRGAFTKEVCEAMAEINERPIIFPLSNPTVLAEATFADAYEWTHGSVVFASGSPFPPLTTHDERTLYPAQANNAYVFPTLGLAAILTRATSIPDDVFLETAVQLAELTPEERLDVGMLFPSFGDMAEISPKLVAHLAQFMVKSGLGQKPEAVKDDWVEYVKSQMFSPSEQTARL